MKSFKRQDLFHYILSVLLLGLSAAVVLSMGLAVHHVTKPKSVLLSLAGEWKIMLNDDAGYAAPGYDDSRWDVITLPGNLTLNTLDKTGALKGIVWLRKTVTIDERLPREDLGLILGRIANADETFFNGEKIGGMGEFQPKEFSMWNHPRNYLAPTGLVRYGADNVIAIRVSYNIFGEVKGPLAVTGKAELQRYSTFVEYILTTLSYIFMAAGMPIFVIFAFFYIRRPDSTEYLFYAFQLACGLIIITEQCNYWNIYGTELFRLKMLAFGWAAINVFHPLFLHRIYDLKRRKMEIVLWIYLALVALLLALVRDDPSARFPVQFFIALTIGIGVYNISCHLAALIKKRPYSKLFSFFGMTVIGGAIHDGIIYLSKFTGNDVHVYGYTFDYLVFAYTAAVLYTGTTLVLVSRFISMSDEIQDMNVNLELKVQERTGELKEARDSLWGEMALAKKIRTMLIPRSPAIPGYQVSAYMRPSEEVSGDYYDVINIEGRDWLVIGDVTGQGVPVGLIMMMAQSAIHTALKQNPDLTPSRLLSVINGTITENIRQLQEGNYMTITVFATHRDGRFSFSGLHQDIIVYRHAARAAEVVETSGFWLGLEQDIDSMVQDDTLTLDIGDAMLIYTDGVIEAQRKGPLASVMGLEVEMFGAERLKNAFHGLGAKTPDEIKDGILHDLSDYITRDDMTLVVIKRVQ